MHNDYSPASHKCSFEKNERKLNTDGTQQAHMIFIFLNKVANISILYAYPNIQLGNNFKTK